LTSKLSRIRDIDMLTSIFMLFDLVKIRIGWNKLCLWPVGHNDRREIAALWGLHIAGFVDEKKLRLEWMIIWLFFWCFELIQRSP
jgi:hypothetical protein